MKKIVILTGASGVGKTTIAERMLMRFPEFSYVRSMTTRPPRGDGHDGEYIYVGKDEFLQAVQRGEFIEHMEYGSNFYGTPKSELERIFTLGKTPLLILDIEGVKSVRKMKLEYKAFAFYIYAPIDDVGKRLYLRELASRKSCGEAESVIQKRLEANRRDYVSLPEIRHLFDAFIKNRSTDEEQREQEIDRAIDEIISETL